MADVVTSGDVTREVSTQVSTQEVMVGEVIAVMAGKLMMER